jgi:hypothetical protein
MSRQDCQESCPIVRNSMAEARVLEVKKTSLETQTNYLM